MVSRQGRWYRPLSINRYNGGTNNTDSNLSVNGFDKGGSGFVYFTPFPCWEANQHCQGGDKEVLHFCQPEITWEPTGVIWDLFCSVISQKFGYLAWRVRGFLCNWWQWWNVSGPFSASQSIRSDATFDIFISLPIVFVFKLLLYLLYIVFVFVAWCICLVHHAPPRSGGRAKCSVVEALVGTRGGILLTTHLLSSSLSPHSCLVRRQNQRWSPCAGRQVISQPGTTLDLTMHEIRMFHSQ